MMDTHTHTQQQLSSSSRALPNIAYYIVAVLDTIRATIAVQHVSSTTRAVVATNSVNTDLLTSTIVMISVSSLTAMHLKFAKL